MLINNKCLDQYCSRLPLTRFTVKISKYINETYNRNVLSLPNKHLNNNYNNEIFINPNISLRESLNISLRENLNLSLTSYAFPISLNFSVAASFCIKKKGLSL